MIQITLKNLNDFLLKTTREFNEAIFSSAKGWSLVGTKPVETYDTILWLQIFVANPFGSTYHGLAHCYNCILTNSKPIEMSDPSQFPTTLCCLLRMEINVICRIQTKDIRYNNSSSRFVVAGKYNLWLV